MTPCAHWWKLATPDGPTVVGICKKCGLERVFRAHLPEPEQNFKYTPRRPLPEYANPVARVNPQNWTWGS